MIDGHVAAGCVDHDRAARKVIAVTSLLLAAAARPLNCSGSRSGTRLRPCIHGAHASFIALPGIWEGGNAGGRLRHNINPLRDHRVFILKLHFHAHGLRVAVYHHARRIVGFWPYSSLARIKQLRVRV